MTQNKLHKIWAVLLLLVLLGVSTLKDDLSPDYRNTPSAAFLNPENATETRIATLSSHPFFWAGGVLYSVCFIILSSLIIQFATNNPALTRFTIWLHIVIVLLLYTAIFINSKTVDVLFVSKVNRYFHSPIITLFLWAAFTIVSKQNDEQVI